VYVRQGAHRKGIGKQLYQNLIERLSKQGIVNFVGVITQPNVESVGLHESLGFKQVALFKNIGFKMGSWWDVGYWQLSLVGS
jgi:phosphinothricin acetyltransferase